MNLRGLSIAVLRELLRANGIALGPQTRKDKLRSAVLCLVATLGSAIHLPNELCRANDRVPMALAILPNAEGRGNGAPLRMLDNA